MGFGLSDPDITNTYVIRCRLKANFHGGLFVENNPASDIVKEQHEFTMAANIEFQVIDIFTVNLEIFDNALNIRKISAKVYDVIAL